MSKDIYDNTKVLPLLSKRFYSLLNDRIYDDQICYFTEVEKKNKMKHQRQHSNDTI
jgi:hypothetical protein